jgi:DNA-3-methyladenine glycosylase II
MNFEFIPQGPFNLSNQNQYFGGWLTLGSDPATIVMAFPVEGWQGSAALTLRQEADGRLVGEVSGPTELLEKARSQGLACLSLDVDGTGWPEVGRRDAWVGQLQERYQYLRPVLFYSAYEAAAAFIIGHRISIKQRRTIMQRMAEQLGEQLEVEDQTFYAFPGPQALLPLKAYPGLSEQKVERLHAVALAALEGWLDREALRALPVEAALARLESLPGIGPFFSQGILYRGAGLVDVITLDDLTPQAIELAYHLGETPGRAEMERIAEPWRPYRMWVNVLLHVWLRREIGTPRKRSFSAPK